MSVYKELGYELQEIIEAQHRLYNDACDMGFWGEGKTRENMITHGSDQKFVDRIRKIVQDDKKYGKVTQEGPVWHFHKECLEMIEDGHKIGFSYDVRSGKDNGRPWIYVEANCL
jgi:hypothetical protein